MQDDYNYLSELALRDKQSRKYEEWIADKIKRTYIRISDDFRGCNFHYSGWFE